MLFNALRSSLAYWVLYVRGLKTRWSLTTGGIESLESSMRNKLFDGALVPQSIDAMRCFAGHIAGWPR
jgi:hypothetical protein